MKRGYLIVSVEQATRCRSLRQLGRAPPRGNRVHLAYLRLQPAANMPRWTSVMLVVNPREESRVPHVVSTPTCCLLHRSVADGSVNVLLNAWKVDQHCVQESYHEAQGWMGDSPLARIRNQNTECEERQDRPGPKLAA